MKRPKWPIGLFFTVATLAILQLLSHFHRLPDTVASHFNRAGVPDAWLSKESFVMIQASVLGLCLVIFSLILIFLPHASHTSMNLPHKDYWLSPQQRPRTMTRLLGFFSLFFSATLLLLMDVFQQAFEVNMGKTAVLAHPMTSLVVYVAVSGVLTVRLIWTFTHPDKG